ncbi:MULTISPECIES: GatB/YqeY domain-containing protein [unclassified Beijerinckia]|uniref:GatB/YqeY domain-containing protein n=1 Tax=unclassified Beijerinckia TaxID=2638183 RepID=UPI00089647BE|nr:MULTISPECIES: GatB/YqeY domain-containing protein [unclassified Beijerinckia]MDH7795509.1 uncharacterized protein YqeY [Beijerinckia sp. GAS462]SEC04554.1 Yqey-like protein [Beijerinckia sp. 28-YEA-48]
MQSAGHDMKIRLRADLRAAMKDRRADEAKLIRTLVAAIDNAEAPPLRADERAADQHRFNDGTAEVERLSLGRAQVQAILMTEIQERERAAAEMDHLERTDRADALRAEVMIAKRYVE